MEKSVEKEMSSTKSEQVSVTMDTRVTPFKNIEEYLKVERKAYENWAKQPKLLLLGSSDSGKSTLLKQLKIVHGSGFTDKEKEQSRMRIISGIFNSLQLLISAIDEFESRDVPEKFRQLIEFSEDWQSNNNVAIQASIIALSKAAWGEPAVQEIFARGYHGLPDSTTFFMNSIDRVMDPKYVPDNEDILNLRTVTQSVSNTIFNIECNVLHVIDVSGLSHHRNNWLSYFEDVSSVLFVASLSCYDQNLAEDGGINRMVDSLVLFDDMLNHPLLKEKTFILFLNKKDIYDVKIKTIHIVDFFPNYKGKKGSVSQGIMYFDSKFRDQNKSKKKVITHITCCTDSSGMKVIIGSVLEGILASLLKHEGLV